jgi:hypothetical protein
MGWTHSLDRGRYMNRILAGKSNIWKTEKERSELHYVELMETGCEDGR